MVCYYSVQILRSDGYKTQHTLLLVSTQCFRSMRNVQSERSLLLWRLSLLLCIEPQHSTQPCFARLCAEPHIPKCTRASHECPRCNIQRKTPHSASERLSAWRSSDTTVVALQTLVGAVLVIVEDRAVGRNESSLGREWGRKKSDQVAFFMIDGAAWRNRTVHLLLTKELLYQMS